MVAREHFLGARERFHGDQGVFSGYQGACLELWECFLAARVGFFLQGLHIFHGCQGALPE